VRASGNNINGNGVAAMKNLLKNKMILLSCPHCLNEYIIVGLSIEELFSCTCPLCGGYCNISLMRKKQLASWIDTYSNNNEVPDNAKK